MTYLYRYNIFFFFFNNFFFKYTLFFLFLVIFKKFTLSNSFNFVSDNFFFLKKFFCNKNFNSHKLNLIKRIKILYKINMYLHQNFINFFKITNIKILFKPVDNFILKNFFKNLFNLNFIRKNKVFNKGRYSRNRQIYRTGVYWSLYVNIIAVIGLYFWFYRFNINFGYCWFFFYFFIFLFFWTKWFNTFFKNSFFIELLNNVKWFLFLLSSVKQNNNFNLLYINFLNFFKIFFLSSFFLILNFFKKNFFIFRRCS